MSVQHVHDYLMSNKFILFPIPEGKTFENRPLNRLFFYFLHIYCRLAPTAKFPLPSVSSRFFWALFSFVMRKSTTFSIQETDRHSLSKLLIRTLDYYYLKDAKKPPYTNKTLPESEKVMKLRTKDKGLPF